MGPEFGSAKSSRRPNSSRSGHPALCGADSGRQRRLMLQEAGRRGAEINQARPDATLADRSAEREGKRWRTWLPVPVANVICLAVHWYVSKTEPAMETRSYFVFLWNFLAVSFLLAFAQLALPRLREKMRQMG